MNKLTIKEYVNLVGQDTESLQAFEAMKLLRHALHLESFHANVKKIDPRFKIIPDMKAILVDEMTGIGYEINLNHSVSELYRDEN